MEIIQFDKIENENYGRKAYYLSLGKKYVYIPNGFVISKEIMRTFLEENNLLENIKNHLKNISGNSIPIASAIQKNIIKADFSSRLSEDILEFYESLSTSSSMEQFLDKPKDALCSVRNGTWAENSDNIYQLNVLGKNKLLESIKVIFASNFISSKIKIKDFEEYINPVIVQKMELVQRSGVATSYNPETRNPTQVMIMASFGLGIAKDDTSLGYDEYIMSDYEISKAKIGKQDYAYEKDIDSVKTVKYSLEENSTRQKIGSEHAKEITQSVKKLSRILNTPLMVEWGLNRNKLVIFDIKPVDIDLHESTPKDISFENINNNNNNNNLENSKEEYEDISVTEEDINFFESINQEEDIPKDNSENEFIEDEEISFYESYPEANEVKEYKEKESEEIPSFTEDLLHEEDIEPITDYDPYHQKSLNLKKIENKAEYEDEIIERDEDLLHEKDPEPMTDYDSYPEAAETINIDEEIDSFDKISNLLNKENDVNENLIENNSFIETTETTEKNNPEIKDLYELTINDLEDVKEDEEDDSSDFAYNFMEDKETSVKNIDSFSNENSTQNKFNDESKSNEYVSIVFDEEIPNSKTFGSPKPIFEVDTNGPSIFDSIDGFDENIEVKNQGIKDSNISNEKIEQPTFEPKEKLEFIEKATSPSITIEEKSQKGYDNTRFEVEEDGDFVFDNDSNEESVPKPEPVIYKDIFMKEKMRQRPELMVDKAFSEASNVVITCDAAILNRMKDKYKALFNKEPHNYFIEMLNELKTKINIPYEEDIKKVRHLREKYLNDYEPLSSEEIMFCLNTSKKFTVEF